MEEIKSCELERQLEILKGQIKSFKHIGLHKKAIEYLPVMQLLYLELKKSTDLIEELSDFEEIQELYKSKKEY